MKSIQIDPSRLLGFRLTAVAASGKVGSKVGTKTELDLKLASAKIGSKVGKKG